MTDSREHASEGPEGPVEGEVPGEVDAGEQPVVVPPEERPVEGPDPGPALSEFANPEAEIDQQVRRYPSTLGGLLFLAVLAGALLGVGISTFGDWRLGIMWLAFSLLVGAAARLVLPDEQAGMLHVRRRLVDVPILVGLAVALLLIAASLPSGPR
jgi:Protein of unknown function (DUF3017)